MVWHMFLNYIHALLLSKCYFNSPNNDSPHSVRYENGFVGPSAVEIVSKDIEKYGFVEHLLLFLGFEYEHQRYDGNNYFDYRSIDSQSSLSSNQTNLFKKVIQNIYIVNFQNY